MHNGPAPFVDRYADLTSSYEHPMASGSDGLVDIYHLYECIKGREGGQKVHNLPNLPILISK